MKWKWLSKITMRVRGQTTTKQLVNAGLIVGKGFSRRNDVFIDGSHAYMITIGDNVTLSAGVVILGHDASTKRALGYTILAPVHIGDNVFIGRNAIILPGVNIGNNVIIGAGSVVKNDIPNGCVVAGNPAKVIRATEDFLEKHRKQLSDAPAFGKEYVGKISKERQKELRDSIKTIGYIV